MGRYSLLRDFVGNLGTGTLAYDLSTTPANQLVDHIDVSADMVLAVVRWKTPITFSRDLMGSAADVDNSNLSDILDIMIVHGDLLSMRTDSSKESYTPTLTALLAPNRDYLAEILPEDWVLAWMVNSPADATDIINRIQKRDACNLFMDGLKFIGRVNSVRENIAVSEEGPKTLRYTINCSAFKELDVQIFYNQYLAQNFPSLNEYLSTMGTSLNKLIDANGGGIDSNRILPEIIEILLGSGVSKQFAAPGGVSIAAGGIATGGSSTEAPYAYVVPAQVANLLGQTNSNRDSGVFSFADILDTVIGVQRFRGTSPSSSGPESMFTPDGVDFAGYAGNRSTTGYLLLGTFLPQAVSFTNTSVWTILNQFLNPAVNEMYACLRVNAKGAVVPTLTARQFPFTTPIGAETASPSIAVTPFLELPRWHLHPILLRQFERGRSAAMHFNFIMITGQDIMMQANNSPTEQIIRNPPIRDDADAKRGGLHPYQLNVACSQQDTFGNSLTPWIRIISDFLVGQHFTLNGTMMTVGIQAPIAVGDNLEYNGVVYHIENVSHQCEITPAGKKRFSTMLALSHGILADPAIDIAATQPIPFGPALPPHNDAGMYYSIRGVPGTGGTSIADGAPTITVEDNTGVSSPTAGDFALPGDQRLV